MSVNRDPVLLSRIEAYFAAQAERRRQARARGEDLGFPFDVPAFEYLYPRSVISPPVREYVERLAALNGALGVGGYRGRFSPHGAHVALHADTDGDHGYLLVFDEAGRLVASACFVNERLSWLPVEEVFAFARELRHP